MLCSIVIPVAGYHQNIYQRAYESALSQTINCQVIIEHDPHGSQGPGITRNKGAAQASGLFLTFLDADDYLEPTFLERCLDAYIPGKYVYTDFMAGEAHFYARDCLDWRRGDWHAVTTLYPRALFHHVAGWSTVPYAEDSEFYLRSQAKGVCGVRVASPLFHYGEGGRRSEDFQKNPERLRILDEYRRINPTVASCCGNDVPNIPIGNPNQFQEGMILAESLYAPARYRGRETGLIYERQMYRGQQMYVWPQDIEADPDSFRRVFVPEAISPDVETVRKLALEALKTKGV